MPIFDRRVTSMRIPAVLIVLALAGAPGVARAQTPAAADLAARIQAHYSTVHDFTASFTLKATSALLTDPAEEHGDLKIKKPNRMRWTWTTADRKVFDSDGTMFYAYFPQDKYVTIRPLPKGSDASVWLLFLAGRGDLTRDFVPRLPADQPPDEWHLVLKPKAPQADFSTLTLEVDRRTLQLRGLVVVDNQGGTESYRFTNMKENQGLPDKDFEFTPPRNVEIRQ